MIVRKANFAVEQIVSDLSDRGALGNAWDDIDEDIQYEIKKTWLDIIVKQYDLARAEDK